MRGGFSKGGHEKRGPQVKSEVGAGEASNLMRRPVQQRDRTATTSACVGWDKSNIENQLGFRKIVKSRATDRTTRQNGFTITKMTITIMRIVGTSLIIR